MNRTLWRLKQKCLSRQGETLPELLISVLIIVLGLTMFASALMAARKMLAEGDTILQGYYQERNILEQENGKTLDATLTLGNVSNVADSRMNLTLPYQSGKDTSDRGTYSIILYTEQKNTDQAQAHSAAAAGTGTATGTGAATGTGTGPATGTGTGTATGPATGTGSGTGTGTGSATDESSSQPKYYRYRIK